MIQMQTVLEAADNSGAKNLRCIKVLGGSKKRYARVGDIIVASIKDSIPNSRVKAGDVVKAVIVRTKKEFRRQDGTYIKLNQYILVCRFHKRELIEILSLEVSR